MSVCRDVAVRHLDIVFGNRDESMKFLICGKDNFAGRWFDDSVEAADWGCLKAEKTDVYFGVGLRRNEPERDDDGVLRKRGLADEVEAIPGFWLDLDVAGPEHKKQNLPPSFEAGRRFIDELFPMHPPSLVVNSGHGLQAYWLFPEVYAFSGPDDRKKLSKYSERFSGTIRAFAKTKGWTIDSVFDISRVLRLAGTVNRKSEPIQTTIEVPNEGTKVVRYELDELEGLLIAEEMVLNDEGKPKILDPVGFLVLSKDRNPPTDALLALVSNNDKARESWEKNRKDLTDQSPSSYDFSLAVLAVRAGWKDQEIADLLVAWRVKHRIEPKSTKRGGIRLDYYQRTISKARSVVAQESVQRPFESDAETVVVAPGTTVSDSERRKIIDKVRRVFGLPIERFVQRGHSDDALFSFVLTDGTSIPIGTASSLDSQTTLRAKIFPVAHKFPVRMKNETFDRMMAALGSIVEVVDNPEATRSGKFGALLFEYFVAKTSNLRESEWSRNLINGEPFIRDECVFLSVTNLEAWIKFSYTRKVTSADLWTDLPEWGFVDKVETARIAGRKINRRYWKASIEELKKSFGFSLPTVPSNGEDDNSEEPDNDSGGSAGSAPVARKTGSALPPWRITPDPSGRDDDRGGTGTGSKRKNTA